MTPEDEQRIRELLDMHPALLQPEAIEMRSHLLDARDDLAFVRAELAEIQRRDETTGGVLYDVIHRAIVGDLADHEAVREIEQRLIQPLVARLRTETLRANGRAARHNEIAALYADLAATRRELRDARDVLAEHGITDEQLHHTLQRIAARRRGVEQSRIHTTRDGSTP